MAVAAVRAVGQEARRARQTTSRREITRHPKQRPPLGQQTRRASSLLLGKTVNSVTRARRGELAVEFTDGSRLSVGATPMGLDVEIKTDAETWAEGGDHSETPVM